MLEELCHRADLENQKQTAVHTSTIGSSVPPLAYSGERYLSGPGNGRSQNCTPKTPYCAHTTLTMADHALWYQQQRCKTLPVGDQL